MTNQIFCFSLVSVAPRDDNVEQATLCHQLTSQHQIHTWTSVHSKLPSTQKKFVLILTAEDEI